ncbi:MAG: hypothetical protein IKL82_05470 [Clostridia bacterium]|nr:hypothetical protein [Clostridia bacterium]
MLRAGSYLLVDPINKVSIVMGFNLTNWPLIFDGLHLKIVEKIYKELKLN